MAIGQTRRGGMPESERRGTGSVKGLWIVANDNAETAQTSGDELDPLAIDDETFHWVQVPEGATRALVRAKIDDEATVSTSPTFFLMGAYGGDPSDSNAKGVTFMRLDNADADAEAVTLTIETGANVVTDGTWDISNPVDLDGYDLKGAWYIGLIVDTAASVSTGTVPIEVMFLN